MERLEFTKMHGCGNDYVYFDCFDRQINSPETLAVTLSDRHYGVGGDGIILIGKSEIADAEMRIFNLDGSEGTMCGNGIRCVGKYLYDSGRVKKDELTVETKSGIKYLKLTVENDKVVLVSVNMGKAGLAPANVPVLLEGESVIDRKVNVNGEDYNITCVSMGNPHCIIFCEDVDAIELAKIGPHFEFNPMFPERVNTEFVSIVDEHTIKMRVWERGSGETLACGTGACASAVAATLNGFCKKGEDVRVILAGGELTINYTDERVIMTGAAEKVFEGFVEV
ncbi:MAG: diaminopimelate epimerase [Oscillospiraceae bacterium]|nr:diaminopimelate epimerase [Oscillospiraceae bacterium]